MTEHAKEVDSVHGVTSNISVRQHRGQHQGRWMRFRAEVQMQIRSIRAGGDEKGRVRVMEEDVRGKCIES